MSEDPRQTLERLVELAAKEDSPEEDVFADPRWEDVAAGRASAATRAELEALAIEAGQADLLELFAPPAPGTAARILRRLEEAPEAESDEVDEEQDEEEPSPESQPESRRGLLVGAPVVPLRASPPSSWPLIAAVVVLAAVFVLFLGRTPSGPEPVAALPRYEATLAGGAKAMRDDEAPSVYHEGVGVEVTLRPSERVDPPPALRAFLQVGDQLLPLAGDLEAAAGGALRFRGALPDQLPAGAMTLWLLLGPPASLTAEAVGPAAPPAGVQRLELSLPRGERP
ncbi:MAG: hypothetical protein R3B72_26820 [Polyangiaceae bacterium]